MNMIEGGLFDVGHVSYVPVPVLTSSVSPSRHNRPLDCEQTPDQDRQHDGSFDMCFAQFGHVGNVPHNRGPNVFTAVAGHLYGTQIGTDDTDQKRTRFDSL